MIINLSESFDFSENDLSPSAYNSLFPSCNQEFRYDFQNITERREHSADNDFQRFFRTTKEETKEKNKIVKFITIKDNQDNTAKFIGKKNKNQKSIENNKYFSKKINNKYNQSNLLYKINADSINCIVNIANSFLGFNNHDKRERFKKINGYFKKNINKKELEKLKKRKLYEIICLPISPKCTNYGKDYNEQLCNKLKEDPKNKILIRFLDETFLSFFRDIYYKNERNINLDKYGINDNLPLSEEVKLSINKINSFDAKGKAYKRAYNQCINENYFEDKLKFFLE